MECTSEEILEGNIPKGAQQDTNRLSISEINDNRTHDVYKEFLYIVLVLVLIDPSINLQEYFQSTCTGTLIREDLVLTSASCFNYHYDVYVRPDPHRTTVFERPANAMHAHQIYIHPLYSGKDSFNFALIKVDKSKHDHFPQLPQKMFRIEEILNTCVLGGYGRQLGMPTLLNFDVLYINDSATEVLNNQHSPDGIEYIFLILQNMIPCMGDIGSPMICNGELFAMYTPREPYPRSPKRCLRRYGTMFTPIYAVNDWIRSVQSIASFNFIWMTNPIYIMLFCGGVLFVLSGIYCVVIEVMHRRFIRIDESAQATSLHSNQEPARVEESTSYSSKVSWQSCKRKWGHY